MDEGVGLDSIRDNLAGIKQKALEEISSAKTIEGLRSVRARYLGRVDGVITAFLRRIKELPEGLRPVAGKEANLLKVELENIIEDALRALKEEHDARIIKGEKIDVTLPGRRPEFGRVHPVTRTAKDITGIFNMLGFETVEGPEIELDYYNFEALNIPQNHPARDMQDTFYLKGNLLLRTHTSPVQIRVMERRKPPLAVVAPGKVFRRDSDVTHSPMFHQVEGFMVQEGISFAHLKGVLTEFLKVFFHQNVPVRFRPSYFPFTEPSAEVDIQCIICSGKGCKVCKNTGWIEVLGCGMIHPQVLRNVHYNPHRFSGFAFGLGVERFAMLRYRIDDIRLFFQNDRRFLCQF